MGLFDIPDETESSTGESTTHRFAVIIPAAGASRRFQNAENKKQFAELQGRAVWLRTVDHFINRSDVSEVVLVLAADDLDSFRDRFRANLAFMNLTITAGGATRADSVQNGIAALTKPADYIAVHDAARPLLTKQWINQIFSAAATDQAVIPGVPVSSTIKRVDDSQQIQDTVDRTGLMLAQTPQVFRRDLLESAFAAAEDLTTFTDEASIVEAAGHPVTVHPGWPMNIKITNPEDLHMAAALLQALPAEGGLQSLL